MPLQVNEEAIKQLAELTGVDATKLKSEIVVEADTPPTESKIKEVLANTVIMPKDKHDTLLDNHGKNKFDEGKHKSLLSLTKVALGDKAFDVTPTMTREEVWDKIKVTAQKDWEKEHGKTPTEWQSEKEKLQQMVREKEEEANKWKGEVDNVKSSFGKREKIIAAVAGIPFEATGENLRKQQDVLKNILSSYDLKVEDGKEVYYKDGKKLVDSYLNPKTIEDIAQEEAVIFPTQKASTGRGDNSSNPNHQSGNLDADLKNATDEAKLNKLIEARGLSPMSDEGRAIVRQWISIHKKA